MGPTVLAGARSLRRPPAPDPQGQRHGILAAIQHGLSNVRIEQINAQIRPTARGAFGFRSPQTLITLAMPKLAN